MCVFKAPNPAATEFIPKGAPRMSSMAHAAVPAFSSPLFPHPGLSGSTAPGLAPGEFQTVFRSGECRSCPDRRRTSLPQVCRCRPARRPSTRPKSPRTRRRRPGAAATPRTPTRLTTWCPPRCPIKVAPHTSSRRRP